MENFVKKILLLPLVLFSSSVFAVTDTSESSGLTFFTTFTPYYSKVNPPIIVGSGCSDMLSRINNSYSANRSATRDLVLTELVSSQETVTGSEWKCTYKRYSGSNVVIGIKNVLKGGHPQSEGSTTWNSNANNLTTCTDFVGLYIDNPSLTPQKVCLKRGESYCRYGGGIVGNSPPTSGGSLTYFLESEHTTNAKCNEGLNNPDPKDPKDPEDPKDPKDPKDPDPDPPVDSDGIIAAIDAHSAAMSDEFSSLSEQLTSEFAFLGEQLSTINDQLFTVIDSLSGIDKKLDSIDGSISDLDLTVSTGLSSVDENLIILQQSLDAKHTDLKETLDTNHTDLKETLDTNHEDLKSSNSSDIDRVIQAIDSKDLSLGDVDLGDVNVKVNLPVDDRFFSSVNNISDLLTEATSESPYSGIDVEYAEPNANPAADSAVSSMSGYLDFIKKALVMNAKECPADFTIDLKISVVTIPLSLLCPFFTLLKFLLHFSVAFMCLKMLYKTFVGGTA